jgi:GDPmannose 4,6-dehydratase
MQWLMLQQDQAEDFVIATGVQYSVRQFCPRSPRSRCAQRWSPATWRRHGKTPCSAQPRVFDVNVRIGVISPWPCHRTAHRPHLRHLRPGWRLPCARAAVARLQGGRHLARCPGGQLPQPGSPGHPGQVELAFHGQQRLSQRPAGLARHEPHEVYHLAGQSSVGLSFEQPVETLESIALSTLNLLEAIRFLGRPIRYYSAGSSECFGDNGDAASNENTPFRPRSPYAVAKAAAFWQVANYREAYGLFACSGILFNHESPLRPERFVTQKIVRTACRIAAGSAETLHLGNLEIHRDWGWAPEYVHAMWLMLQQPTPQDFVIATGVTYPLADFVAETFQCLGLDWRQHVISDPSLMRPTDLRISRANPARAETVLGWKARLLMPDVVRAMVTAELQTPK